MKAGAHGIVAAGLGSGSAPVDFMNALRDAVKADSIVLVASQVGSGRVVRRNQFIADGFVVADNLSPRKARILLMLALAQTTDASEIQRMALMY